MPGTILIGTPESDWREFVGQESYASWLMLDPAETSWGPPARALHMRGEKPADWAFCGTIAATKCASQLISITGDWLRSGSVEAVLAPSYRDSPAALSLLCDLVSLMRPERILIDSRCALINFGWPVEPEPLELPSHPAPNIRGALRKAQWLKHFGTCSDHLATLSGVTWLHSRIGSGKRLSAEELVRLNLKGVPYAEVSGPTLFLVTESGVDDLAVARALDQTHTHRAQVTLASAYENLLCAALDGSWNLLGMGVIEGIDFSSGEVRMKLNAVAPAPIAAIHVGRLYVDSSGREVGEAILGEV